MVFKCKMCGGDITPIKDTNTGKCEYCKSVMTLPNLDDEKIVNLYNRANFLRIENDFDKAKEVYENILSIDNNQIEAHWGVLLCKYGVEYVDDPKTGKKIPTCHRTMDTSILNDKDFKIIKKESYGDALELYKNEAETIDKIQKDILSISLKEKPYDVFICYKETDNKNERTKDSVIAQDIYDKLVEQGFKVFFARITLEDKLGKEYEPYIYSALKSSKVMLVVGTKEEYFNAVWVKNEWSRYLEMMKQDKGKTLIPVYSKIDPYKLPEEFAMLQAQSMDKVGALQDLTRGVKKLVNEYKSEYTDYDQETIAKVASALDEARSIGNGKYEVTIVKENLPIWYYSLIIFCGIISIFIYSALWFDYNFTQINNFLRSFRIPQISLYSAVCYILSGLLYLLALFSSITKRKFFKYRKALVFSSFSTLVVFILINLQKYYIPQKNFLIFLSVIVVTMIVIYLLNPSWKLSTSTKSIMEKDEKDKQLEKNKKLKENFILKEKSSVKIVCFMFVLLLIFGIFTFYKVSPKIKSGYYNFESNERDTNKLQVQVTTKYINVRENHGVGYDIKGKVYETNIYTVLDTYNEYSNIWYKISTDDGVQGWIAGKYAGEQNVEVLEKE